MYPIFVCTCIFLSTASYAQYDFTPQLHEAYQDLLKLKISSARNKIQSSLDKDPNNGIAIYLDNYVDVAEIIITEDEKLYDLKSDLGEKRIEQLKKLSKKSPYHLFVLGEVRLQWAFAKMIFDDRIDAFFNLRSAYKTLDENIKKYPNFIPSKKSMGLLQILLGSIPDEYKWLAKGVGLSGSTKLGLKYIDEVAASNNMYALEASLLKAIANAYIIRNENDAVQSARILYVTNKDNLLIHFVYASLLFKTAQNDAALEILKTKPVGPEYISFSMLDYMQGEAFLNKGQYKRAVISYIEFIKKHKGKNYIKSAYFKIFMAYWANDEDKKALAFYEDVKNKGINNIPSDNYAQELVESGNYPDKTLLKARLFTDGGYYEQALALLSEKKPENFTQRRDRIEYFYRLARIYHAKNQFNQAIIYYKKTIQQTTENDHYYFAPNSCLQLGYIYTSLNDEKAAESYFKKSISYSKHEYKRSIDYKAKEELEKIEERK